MGRRKKKKKNSNLKWIIHYSSKHDILLVGEGDFSFLRFTGQGLRRCYHMVATSRDSRVSVTSKYSRGKENLETLEEHGCSILHGVDVHSIDRHPDLKGRLFNMIIFNFPHAGCHSEYIVESSEDQIKRHRKLVKGFLMNASTLLSCGGEIHMTHKKCYPFSEWKDNELGEEVGLKVLEEVEFSKWDYRYHNKKCYGRHPDKTFPVGYSTTLKFVLK